MKNVLKKSNILSFIIGGFIFGIIGIVSATILYQANEIGYTPNDESEINNVQDALDDLYNKQNTTISGLNSQISTLETSNNNLLNQVDRLTTQLANATNAGAYGDFTTTNSTTVHTINVGFKPSRLFVIVSNNILYGTIQYDANTSVSRFYYQVNSTGQTGGGVNPLTDFSFSISDTGFNYKAGNDSLIGKTYWYAIK